MRVQGDKDRKEVRRLRNWRLREWLLKASSWDCISTTNLTPVQAMSKQTELTKEYGQPQVGVNPEWDTVEFVWLPQGAKITLSQFPCS